MARSPLTAPFRARPGHRRRGEVADDGQPQARTRRVLVQPLAMSTPTSQASGTRPGPSSSMVLTRRMSGRRRSGYDLDRCRSPATARVVEQVGQHLAQVLGLDGGRGGRAARTLYSMPRGPCRRRMALRIGVSTASASATAPGVLREAAARARHLIVDLATHPVRIASGWCAPPRPALRVQPLAPSSTRIASGVFRA